MSIDPDIERIWSAADARVSAPRGFDERLFARLASEAPVRATAPAPVPEAMPWWVRAAGERHVALALAIAAILLASPAWWFRATGPAMESFSSMARVFLAPWLAPLAQAFAQPRVELAVALGFAPLLAWGAYLLTRAIERGTVRMTLRLRA